LILRKDQVWKEMVIGIRLRYAYLELYPVPSGCYILSGVSNRWNGRELDVGSLVVWLGTRFLDAVYRAGR
jgi:hypothetical protein